MVLALGSGLMNVGVSSDTGGLVITGPRESVADTAVMNIPKFLFNLIETAIEKGKAALELSNIKEILDGVVSLYNLFADKFKKLSEAYDITMKKKLAAMHLYAATEIAITQAKIDAATNNARLVEVLNSLPSALPPKNEYLCKKVLAYQIATTTQGFEKEGSRMAAEAISGRYRCPTCDGKGSDFVGKEQARRCNKGYGNAIDGAGDFCKDSTASGKSLADADISPIDGSQIYQMPQMDTQSYKNDLTGESLTVSVPAPQNEQQQLWVAAWDNIFLLAGPRPTPRSGKGMKTPVGKVQRAMFNHCVASENALVKQCTDLLMYYTRPNCAESAKLCETQQQECLAATGFLDLAPYQECGKDVALSKWQGLSPYEAEEINQRLCKSEQNNNNLLQAGSKHKDLLLDTADLCDLSGQSWKESVAQKHENCHAATQAMQKLQTCWEAVGE